MAHQFLESLRRHEEFWQAHYPERAEIRERYRQFVEEVPDCFQREHLARHITGSALVVSPDRQQVLLTHHAKLKLWIQLGGHCDGDPEVWSVAEREVEEESGLRARHVTWCEQELTPFDVDILPVPKWGDVPEHDHYDTRYLMEADPALPLQITSESLDLKWFPVERVREFCEPTILRLLDKVEILNREPKAVKAC